ncbi:Pycsar system effector family protein [Olivibacter sp. XZL3]|uniref:Pycsar system effector family protein n=1 Tax=Olivibacter sp. XZL3 TaxID=1735116 RepID=UPI00106555B0|nr:Pycsar system effector family protein [Olivibacter sp. XZL3]
MDYQAITQEAENWIKDYIHARNNTALCFHDMKHTLQVVDATKKIGAYYQLSERDNFIVGIAAYFHDVGYYTGPPDKHEVRSAEIAERFLRERQVEDALVDAVKNCIIATRMPQNPQNLLEKILCDADLYHFGSDGFNERNKLMRKEAERCRGKAIDKEAWRKGTIDLMEKHRYHTEYANLFLNDKKRKNLDSLTKADRTSIMEDDKKNKKEKDKRPDRGIETMFRVTSTNNQRLSDMADNKSNILITVNSIILSVIIALLLRKLDSNEHLVLPTFVLLAVSLSTMVTAILATRPYIPNGVFSAEDMKEQKVNLLFFGNFYKMGLQEYDEGMRTVMEDRNFLYGTLIKDVYSQGVVLGRKYRLLRIAYNIFMYGLIASVLSFIVTILIFQ